MKTLALALVATVILGVGSLALGNGAAQNADCCCAPCPGPCPGCCE